MAWLEDFLKGVGKTGSTLFGATAAGQRMNMQKQRGVENRRAEFSQRLQFAKTIQNEKELAEFANQMQADFPDIMGPMQDKFKAANFRSGPEARARKSYKSLTPEERKRWSNYGGIRSQGTQKSKGDRMVDALEKQAKMQKARDIVTPEEGELEPDQAERFRQAFETVNQEGGFRPAPKGQPAPPAEPKTEVEKRIKGQAASFFNTDVRPARINFKPPAEEPGGIKGYFSGGKPSSNSTRSRRACRIWT
jgi:hypothetical protein